MRVLHTSDWHLGRSFHGHSTLPQLREVLGTIPAMVRRHEVDVVVVAGDVFDHAAPAAELFEVLTWAIRGIRDAGAAVVLISGNHDNAARLGFQSEWAALGAVHVLTRSDAYRHPIELHDEHGAVDFYGIPYLEPMLQRDLYPNERLREHRSLLRRVMAEVNEIRSARGHRSVVVSHCFAANAGGGAEGADADGGSRDESDALAAGAGLVWDLTSGGVDLVEAAVFDGPDYVALGHLHGRSELSERVRYSGAPLHFSFGEASRPRGAWLVVLDASGFSRAEWLAFPVPRPLARLRGTLDDLLAAPDLVAHEASWIEATLTDTVRPIDAMRRLRERFPFCARIVFDPEGASAQQHRSYASRVSQRSDTEIVDEFLHHVRGGEGLDGAERDLLAEVLVEVRAGTVEGNAASVGNGRPR